MKEQIKIKNQKTGFAKLEKFGVTKEKQLTVKGGHGGVVALPIQ